MKERARWATALERELRKLVQLLPNTGTLKIHFDVEHAVVHDPDRGAVVECWTKALEVLGAVERVRIRISVGEKGRLGNQIAQSLRETQGEKAGLRKDVEIAKASRWFHTPWYDQDCEWDVAENGDW